MKEYKIGDGSPVEHIAKLLNDTMPGHEKEGWQLLQVIIVNQIVPVQQRIINGRSHAGPQAIQMGFPILVRETDRQDHENSNSENP